VRRAQQRGPSPLAAGVLALIVVGIVGWAGFTKRNPFAQRFELRAAFAHVNDLRPKSPVRIAGVNVGTVRSVEHIQTGGRPAALVTMEIDRRGLPLHRDATLKVRPRIFLEGNYFVDLQPGSPSAPVLRDGATVPVQQTAAPVQLGQVLSALQSDTRDDLRTFLREYGKAVQGGGRAFNRSIAYWRPAFRDASVVNDATRGIEEHDLSGYLRGAGRVAGGLDRDPAQLRSLVTGFAATAAAFASEQANLSAAVHELPRTLGQGRRTLGVLNGAFPSVRRFARDARPALRSSRPALEAQLPLVRQLRALMSPRELRGLTRDLDPLVPALTRLNRRGVGLQEQQRALASCSGQVLDAWQEATVPDANFKSAGPVYQEAAKAFTGLAGESRSFDANGQYVRTLAKNANFAYALGDGRFFLTDLPVEGVNPPKAPPPPYQPGVPCETQAPPDLRTEVQPPPPAIRVDQSAPGAAARRAAAQRTALDWMRDQLKATGLDQRLTLSDEPLRADQIDDVVRTLEGGG
jgi:phospholipid/cholesterol/gamma-HCH transport system substrate-binding protein